MNKLKTVWVWSDTLNDWRAVKSKRPWQKKARTSVITSRAASMQRKLKKRKKIVTVRASSQGKPSRPPKGKQFLSADQRKWQLIRQQLTGDLDADVDLLYRIAKVSKEIDVPLYVAEGQRSVADQWKYWWAYKRGTGPLAAFPGTSNHTWGNAADVRRSKDSWQNIGDIPGARKAMKKYGLSLPVPGETWHTEIGKSWRA